VGLDHMSLTLEEIAERLAARMDPEELCDLLQISSEELVARFDDKIANDYDKLCEEVENV
jgi:hypothetical protein